MAATTPAAIVQHATLPTQRVVVATLADLPARAEAANLASPTVIVIGEVVKLRTTCGWFDAATVP